MSERTPLDRFLGLAGVVAVLVFMSLLAVAVICGGCMSSSVSVTLTDSNSMMGFVRLQGDSLAPGFGSESGPRLSAALGKDPGVSAHVRGTAVLSNRTTFAGCYVSDEYKTIGFDMILSGPVSTNSAGFR